MYPPPLADLLTRPISQMIQTRVAPVSQSVPATTKRKGLCQTSCGALPGRGFEAIVFRLFGRGPLSHPSNVTKLQFRSQELHWQVERLPL